MYSMIKIGVLDSGIGGVSIVKGCIEQGALGEYIYMYDNKYHPYGGRSKEELTAIACINVATLVERGAEIIILACNTITSAAIDDLRRTFSVPIIGTEPAIAPACKECRSVTVLATPYMAASERMAKLLSRHKNIKFYMPDCSGLATAIEYGLLNREMMQDKFDRVLGRCSDSEGVVLGCTHYNFARGVIADIMPQAKLYDSVVGVARRLKSCMSPLHWESDESIINIIVSQVNIDNARRDIIDKYLCHRVRYD